MHWLNYETVKCFNNEELERQKLEEAIISYQNVEYKLMASLNGLNMLQSIIIFSGLIAGLFVCTKVSTSALLVNAWLRMDTTCNQLMRYILHVPMLIQALGLGLHVFQPES